MDLFYAHGLRQSPETLASTGFAVHQDTYNSSRRTTQQRPPTPTTHRGRLTTTLAHDDALPTRTCREDFDFIEYTIVVKLTPDEAGEAPSAMRVVGAPRTFAYGPEAGASGAFRARLFHASIVSAS